MSNAKESKGKRMTRMIALIVAGVMVISVIGAAILSQVW